jgi:hypothetical protein
MMQMNRTEVREPAPVVVRHFLAYGIEVTKDRMRKIQRSFTVMSEGIIQSIGGAISTIFHIHG